MKLHFEPDLDYQHTAIESVWRPLSWPGDLPYRVHRQPYMHAAWNRTPPPNGTTAWQLIGLLGPTEAAEPLPPGCSSCSSVIEGSERRSFHWLELAES